MRNDDVNVDQSLLHQVVTPTACVGKVGPL